MDPLITFFLAVLLCAGGVIYVSIMARMEREGRCRRGGVVVRARVRRD